MRLLHLHRQHLLLDLARRRLSSGSWPAGPVVLGGKPWSNATVLDADPAARALGVRRGMPLGSAHRLAPEATFLDPQPEADRDELEAAFERLGTFSPAVAGTSDPTDVAFDSKGRVFISEYGDHDRIQVFDGEGRSLYAFGSFGQADGHDLIQETTKGNNVQSVSITVSPPGSTIPTFPATFSG